MIDSTDPRTTTSNIRKQAYELSIPLIRDYITKPIEDVTKKYNMDMADLRKVVYNNLPNVIRFEPEIVNLLNVRNISKPSHNRKNKYTVGLRDWLQQFIFPSQDTLKFKNRIMAPYISTTFSSDNLNKIIVLDDRTGDILEDGYVTTCHIEKPWFETLQIFILPSKMSQYGFTEQASYSSLGEVVWRVMTADRLDLLCYDLTALQKEVQEGLVQKVGSSKLIKNKILLTNGVVPNIISDVQKMALFILYKSTYTAHLK